MITYLVKTTATKYFEGYILPRWYAQAANRRSPRYWRAAAFEAERLVPEIGELAIDISHLEAVLRFLVNTFRVDRSFPTSADIAIAIAYELLTQSRSAHPRVVRKYATTFRRARIHQLNQHPLMKWYLRDRCDRHPRALADSDAPMASDIDDVLTSRTLLESEFFARYNEQNGADAVKVWLPSIKDHRVVEYDRTLTVRVVTAQTLDLGFLRYSHDCSMRVDGHDFWLRWAHLNPADGTTFAVFQCHGLIVPPGPVMWAM